MGKININRVKWIKQREDAKNEVIYRKEDKNNRR